VVEDEEVVVVAADGAGGPADAVQLQRGEIACAGGKEIGLDLLGDGELALQPLFFLLLDEQAFERAGHAVEGVRELAELVLLDSWRSGNAMREVASVDPLGGLVEFLHRAVMVPLRRSAIHRASASINANATKSATSP